MSGIVFDTSLFVIVFHKNVDFFSQKKYVDDFLRDKETFVHSMDKFR